MATIGLILKKGITTVTNEAILRKLSEKDVIIRINWVIDIIMDLRMLLAKLDVLTLHESKLTSRPFIHKYCPLQRKLELDEKKV